MKMKHINLRWPDHAALLSRRVTAIFYAILCFHIVTILAFFIYNARFHEREAVASNPDLQALTHIASDSFLGSAVDASARQDWDAVSLHIARYLALSFHGELEFDGEALSECLYRIDLRPTAFISGNYTQPFLDWFVMVPTKYWTAEPVHTQSSAFLLEESAKNGKHICIIGQPFLEAYTIMGMTDYPYAPIPMIVDAEILVGTMENNTFRIDKRVEFPGGGLPVQYIWPPEFHDLDGDGHDEIWIRFNREAADGFTQCLAIYRDEPDHLSLIEEFIGFSEGIARRLPGGNVQVGYGCEAEGEAEGHLGYSQFTLETLEYQNGSFIKVSERRIPHILSSDAWLDFYDMRGPRET